MPESTTPEPIASEPSVFGSAFESALADVFGAALEPANPVADIPAEPGTPTEPTTPAEPVKPVESLDEVTPDTDDGEVKLPIDEPVEPPTASEEDLEPDTTGMTKSAATRFKELRTEMKEFKSKLATEASARAQAEARIKELEGLTGQSEEVTKKLAEYELELSLSKLEATEQYKTTVTAPLSEIASAATAIATKYDIDANKLLDAIALSDQAAQDEAFDDLLSGVNERDKLKIYAAAEKLPAVLAERERLHNDREGALKELEARQAQATAAQAAENAKARKAATELVAARVIEKLPFLKKDAFNVDAVKQKVADEDFDSADTTVKAYNALSGRLVPQMAQYIDTILKDLEKVTDELSKFKKASPAPKGAGGTPAPADANLSFADSIERAMASMGA